jgi:predicted TIM-barrel fold metal-dependent hydrolase
VGSVDLLQPDACDTIRRSVDRGLAGLRLFTGGSTKDFDSSTLDDPRSFAAWALCGELGLPICIQTDPSGLAQVAGLAKRFPQVAIILDHLGRPDVTDGPPYNHASSLFGLQPFENIFLKLTPRIFGDVKKGRASPETFFPRLVEAFGSDRLAWGSNYPTSEGELSENLAIAQERLSCMSADDQAWIFSGTAERLYPALADEASDRRRASAV